MAGQAGPEQVERRVERRERGGGGGGCLAQAESIFAPFQQSGARVS